LAIVGPATLARASANEALVTRWRYAELELERKSHAFSESVSALLLDWP
jgi:hypothetical protein